jgi:N-methylhydantoinase B/oxoprolinase/acetone carboxylase alpha subunit
MAAVLYVFRTLVDDDIPLNAGCLKPLQVIVPEGCMLNPRPPAAVVAGNVETSMCVTNALYGALGVMAASQCTMNNFTFGNAATSTTRPSRAAPAPGRGFDGTSVVQTHMTNSRLTDPEVLEFRFPVRLDSYAIRRGSGGAGRWRGGDGGVRRVRFLEPMTASILSNGRHVPAFGGRRPAGALGANRIERADGRVEVLDHIGSAEMAPGDVFVIETPGRRSGRAVQQRRHLRLQSRLLRPAARPAAPAFGTQRLPASSAAAVPGAARRAQPAAGDDGGKRGAGARRGLGNAGGPRRDRRPAGLSRVPASRRDRRCRRGSRASAAWPAA